jgi:hypothetical protein
MSLENNIRSFNQLLPKISHGNFVKECDRVMREMLSELNEQKGPTGEIKGALTIQIGFIIEENRVQLVPQVFAKTPKRDLASSVFFITDDAELSITDTRSPTFDDLEQRRREAAER